MIKYKVPRGHLIKLSFVNTYFNYYGGLCNVIIFQVVNVPSFIVRLDSQKHIDFSLKSPFGGGRPGRVKRKNAKKGSGGGGDEDED